ncbi:basic proline-rich protein-like [Cervus elaphus]|uniref:basic proline-rich protein-like n=1 Tax=Cervus elaphus TaxID=9860 RepID=UPI001CC2C46F|nr:basic proline-rich protein-like [Cervus elaphus]
MGEDTQGTWRVTWPKAAPTPPPPPTPRDLRVQQIHSDTALLWEWKKALLGLVESSFPPGTGRARALGKWWGWGLRSGGLAREEGPAQTDPLPRVVQAPHSPPSPPPAHHGEGLHSLGGSPGNTPPPWPVGRGQIRPGCRGPAPARRRTFFCLVRPGASPRPAPPPPGPDPTDGPTAPAPQPLRAPRQHLLRTRWEPRGPGGLEWAV